MNKVVVTDNTGVVTCARDVCELVQECSPVVGAAVARAATAVEIASVFKIPAFFQNPDGTAAILKKGTVAPIVGVALTTAAPTAGDLVNAVKIPTMFNLNPLTGEFDIVASDGTTYHVTPCTPGVSDGTTVTGNGTTGTPYAVNPNAFVGVAQAGAPTAAQLAAAIKVPFMFNFKCTGGTGGKPIFDVVKPDGTLCTIDVGA